MNFYTLITMSDLMRLRILLKLMMTSKERDFGAFKVMANI